jgi:CRISPR-associated protein Csx14
MLELQLRLDPCNPGQFYACCGLLELAAAHSPDALAHFVCDENVPRCAMFVIEGQDLPALTALLQALRDLKPEPLVKTEPTAIDPVSVTICGHIFLLDWWLNEFCDDTTNLKCWAGQVTTRKLFEELPQLIDPQRAAANPMQFAGLTKSKFGVDPRSAWNALDFGYSPNVHNRDAATYPAVEVLAAIGLQGFRPHAAKRSDIAYSLWTIPLPLTVARIAAAAPWDGLPRCDYSFDIEKRGQSYKFFTFGKFKQKKANCQ